MPVNFKLGVVLGENKVQIVLTDEYGLTYEAFTNKEYLEVIKRDLNLKSIEKLWFRPSFGKRAGVKYIEKEKGYSGFGESDALILGVDEADCTKLIFVESRIGNIIKSTESFIELQYWFYLKVCLIDAMINEPTLKQLPSTKPQYYYCVELNGSTSMSNELYLYYKKYRPKAAERASGWEVLIDSDSSIALKDIEDMLLEKVKLKFELYAIGFIKSEGSFDKKPMFDISKIPEKTRNMFNAKDALKVNFRTFQIKNNYLLKEL